MHKEKCEYCPPYDLSPKVVKRLEKLAAAKGFHLWVEPCVECCEYDRVYFELSGHYGPLEIAWLFKRMPDIAEYPYPDPDLTHLPGCFD